MVSDKICIISPYKGKIVVEVQSTAGKYLTIVGSASNSMEESDSSEFAGVSWVEVIQPDWWTGF